MQNPLEENSHLANHQLVQGWQRWLFWLVVVGFGQSLEGNIILKSLWRKFHLDCESLKTFIRLVNIGVGVQLGHVASYSGGGEVYKT